MRAILLSLVSLTLFAEQEPEGRAAFISASLAYHRGAYDDAITGYQQTIALHLEVPFSKMMISRLWNLKGEVDKAVLALDEAAEFEFPGVNIIQTDPEFGEVRLDPRYPAILAKVRLNNQFQACRQRATRRQFDFWLGAWDVAGPDGKPIGVDRIELNDGNCLLRETWTGVTDGDTGQSNTFYTIVNASYVDEIRSIGNGDHQIRLRTGVTVTLSRTYEEKLPLLLKTTF